MDGVSGYRPPETNTYGSQSTMMLKVVGSKATTVIFMADVWQPATQWDSRYLWMPLEIGAGRLRLPRRGMDPRCRDWRGGHQKLAGSNLRFAFESSSIMASSIFAPRGRRPDRRLALSVSAHAASAQSAEVIVNISMTAEGRKITRPTPDDLPITCP